MKIDLAEVQLINTEILTKNHILVVKIDKGNLPASKIKEHFDTVSGGIRALVGEDVKILVTDKSTVISIIEEVE
jgi:hypothetical protein